jgi:hypothetical protein
MKNVTAPPAEVLVVLDPNFGERLRHVSPGQPVWITMSPTNSPVVRALRTNATSTSHLSGITGFPYQQGVLAESCFLDLLGDVDLHHGPYSTTTPYTVLKVIGARLTPAIQCALSDLGFWELQQSPAGFTATRGEDEAKRLRGP